MMGSVRREMARGKNCGFHWTHGFDLLVPKDRLDPAHDVRSTRRRDERVWRLDVASTDVQQGARVEPWPVQRPQDVFVAGPLAFVNEPAADEPHQRVPPEDHLHDHMDDCREIVVAANVAQFMCNEGRELTGCQVTLDVGRYQENRPPHSIDARLHQSWHGANGHVIWNAHRQSSRTARSDDASKTYATSRNAAPRLPRIRTSMRAEVSRRKRARPGTREPAGTENAPATETRETHSARAHTERGRHCGETQLSVDRGRWRTPSLARCVRRCCVTSKSRRAGTAANLEERAPGPSSHAQVGHGRPGATRANARRPDVVVSAFAIAMCRIS